MQKLVVPTRWRKLTFPEVENSPGALEEAIAPLVYALNKIGLPTQASCEGKYRFKTAYCPFVSYLVRDENIEAKLKETIKVGGFSWCIVDLNMPIPIHEMSPEIKDRSPSGVKAARVQSVELAQHVLEYFKLLPAEAKAFEMMEQYKQELRTMPITHMR